MLWTQVLVEKLGGVGVLAFARFTQGAKLRPRLSVGLGDNTLADQGAIAKFEPERVGFTNHQ